LPAPLPQFDPMVPIANVDEDPRSSELAIMLRLHWFIRLRWVFLAASVAVLMVERFVTPAATRPVELAVLLALLGVVNIIWTLWSKWLFERYQSTGAALCGRICQIQLHANCQVAVDLLLLTGILRYTGGVESPLALFYLFHMAIVALILRPWQALLQGAWAATLYGGLAIGQYVGLFAPYSAFLPARPGPLHTDAVGVAVMVGVVACGVFGTLYFTLNIAQRLHMRELQLKRANAALQQSQQAIQDLQRRRSRFMQTAAHQLKSPLAVIQTLTDLIRTNIVPPEAIPGTCEKIVRRCRDGIQQVGELLTLARVQEADPTRYRSAEADVVAVIRDLFQRYRPIAENEQIDLVCRVPDGVRLAVSVDAQDLRDCIGNLIENAIKYTHGPGNVWISVIPKRKGERLESVAISVTDTGIGVDPKLLRVDEDAPDHQPIFEAFRRGQNVIAASIAGSGLGLSIVREVVEQAGGHIHVASSPGRGSSFTVTLPARGTTGSFSTRSTRISQIEIEPTAPLPPTDG
jgi:signal transduction histidine kinase